jgi:hypothetical protein
VLLLLQLGTVFLMKIDVEGRVVPVFASVTKLDGSGCRFSHVSATRCSTAA